MSKKIIEVKSCKGCPYDSETISYYNKGIIDKDEFCHLLINDICVLTGEFTVDYAFSVRRDCPLKENIDE